MNIKNIILRLLSICCLILETASAQNFLEVGNLPIQNFLPSEYGAFRQNWGIAEDGRGLIYVANKWGVLEYDGTKWQLLKGLEDDVEPMDLVFDPLGRLWVGCENELGFFAPDSTGTLTYQSQLEGIPDSMRSFGMIRQAISFDDQLAFRADRHLLIWSEKEGLSVFESEKTIYQVYTFQGKLLAQIKEKGLFQVSGSGFQLLSSHSLFTKENVVSVVQHTPKTLLVFTQSAGVYEIPAEIQPGIEPKRFATGFDQFRTGAILSAIVSGRGRVAVSISGQGVIILDRAGRIVQIINKQAGLRDGIVNRMYTDSRNLLWMATMNGVSVAVENSPLSSKGEEEELEGTVESITRFNGKLYVATHNGLYVLGEESQINIHSLSDLKPPFYRHPYFNQSCWVVVCAMDVLLVAADNGLYQIDKGGKIDMVYDAHPVIYGITGSSRMKNSVWLATRDGLVLLANSGGKWMEAGFIETEVELLSAIEHKDRVWAGGLNEGMVYQIERPRLEGGKLNHDAVTSYDSTNGLPQSQIALFTRNEKLLAGTAFGLMEFDPGSGKFVPSNVLGTRLSNGGINFIRVLGDPNGFYWISLFSEEGGKSFGFAEPGAGGSYSWNEHYFKSVAREEIVAIHHDQGGIIWFGGPGGLHRFDLSQVEESTKKIPVLVRKTQFGNRILFNGTFFDNNGNVQMNQTDLFRPSIKFDNNSFNVSFSAVHADIGTFLKYSYKLNGLDDFWSEPEKINAVNYSNLSKGEYEFLVKCIDENGVESEASAFSFTILPPWYETGLFYILQTLFLVGMLAASFLLNRSGNSSRLSTVLTLVTIITIFEIVVAIIEPYLDDYASGVPVFKLAMNIMLALSLNPLEGLVRKMLTRDSSH